MIQTVFRKEVLEQKNLRAIIASLQQFIYADWAGRAETDHEKEIIREYFDCLEGSPPPETFASLILAHSSTSLNHYPSAVARSFSKLMDILGVGEYYMIAHLPHQLLAKSKMSYPPLAKAYKRLAALSPADSRKHAFLISNELSAEVIKSIFWIHRCDQSVPEYVFFSPKDDSFVMSLCKYGNLHFEAFTPERADQINTLHSKAGLITIIPPETERFKNQ
ncbi:MAG: hypothetical protein HRU80_15740 [Ignavibacteriales bacterium]|nr:MAG: hypothetical protein HRU80_15740 [Ignavibacteriales bacterium]